MNVRPPALGRFALILAISVLFPGCGFLGGGEQMATLDGTRVAGVTAANGGPLLTNANWELAVKDAERYRGARVDITGRVFYVVGNYDGASHYQIFTDPASQGGNTHVAVFPSGPKLAEGDTVRVTGTLDGLLVVQSRGGTELRLPRVRADRVTILSGPSFVGTPTPEPVTAAPTVEPVAVAEVPSPGATPTIVDMPTPDALASTPITTVNPDLPTATVAPPPPPRSPIAGPFAVVAHANALSSSGSIAMVESDGGAYFVSDRSSREWGGSGPLPDGVGAASLDLTIPETGRYAVWLELQYQHVDANSLWLIVDGQRAVLVGNEDAGYESWRWVGWRDGNQGARLAFDLAAGQHTITVASREAGTRFREVLVTRDLDFRPSAAPSGPQSGNPPAATPMASPSPAQMSAAAASAAPTPTPFPQPTALASPTAARPNPSAKAVGETTNASQPSATTAATLTPSPAVATSPPTASPSRTVVPAPSATRPVPASTVAATPTATRPIPPNAGATPTAAGQAPPAEQPGRISGASYTVQPGDTLSAISQRAYGDASQYQRIFAANRDKLSSPDIIVPGTLLQIPR